ncbi:MAG TPA: hypothetical protein VGA00_14480 [Acidiferrobacterales bacterium]
MRAPVDFNAKCRRPAWVVRQWRFLTGATCRGFRSWLLVCLPLTIESAMRHLDLALNRNFGGPWQRLFMPGHSLVPLLFMFTAIAFTVLGPTPRFRGALSVVGIIVAAALFWAAVRYGLRRRGDGRGLLSLQIPILAALAAIFAYALPAADATEAAAAPYRNVFAPAILLLLLVAAASHLVARFAMGGFRSPERDQFHRLLRDAELFVVWRTPGVDLRKILHGFVNAPLYHPLHLLLMPAFGMILVKPQNVVLTGALLAALAWVLLTLSGVHERLHMMISVVRRALLIGGQLVVSLAIIGLAGARLAGIDYVTTPLDSTPGKVILFYILAAYTAFWLYEYWINRALTERLLPLLLPPGRAPERVARVDYPIAAARVGTDVLARGRAIEAFSGARFVVTGGYRAAGSPGPCPAWEPYDKLALFAELTKQAQTLSGWSAEDKRRVRVALSDLGKRTRLYFNLMNMLLIAAVGGALLALHCIPERPEAVAAYIDAGNRAQQPVSLAELMFETRRRSGRLILVAASGGGTRAALYGASTLRGIAALGRLDDVVLVSGVSGGSAALGYFALHRASLIGANPAACSAGTLAEFEFDDGTRAARDPWCAYIAAMGRPYIEDVLRGSSELDVLMSKSLGHLLDESFVRGFGQSGQPPVRLSDIAGLGLILNTTLAGHPAGDSPWLARLFADQPAARERDYAVGAGARLIFTNIRETGAFPRAAGALPQAEDEYFKYVIVGGPRATVTAAAALSANFPPVFSNAAVAVHPATPDGAPARYWVTDGGAADNRGIISLLYALKGALAECPRPCAGGRPPEIHVIVADASAVTIDYRSDRGGGSILGAANKFASQLMLELVGEVRRQYAALGGRLVVHYLPMPAVLRVRGGLGTHWMMPERVTLTDICAADPKRAAKLDIERWPLMQLIADLHPADPPPPGPDDRDCARAGDTAGDWVRADRHARAWARIVEALR